MGCFDEFLDTAPGDKTMRGNGISTFLLHVAQCIPYHLKKIVSATLISNASSKSFYSRLGFKVIKDIVISPNFGEAHNRFNFESGQSRTLQKQTIVLQCHLTIPRLIKINVVPKERRSTVNPQQGNM